MTEDVKQYSEQRMRDEGDMRSKNTKREKYLVFKLHEECYGIPLSSVKEVIGLTEITGIPQVPDFFKGLINLRGRIISVLDLRAKLHLPPAEYEEKKTCIIIVEIQDLVIGIIVDDVQQVAGFMSDQIEADIDIQSSVHRDAITGVAKADQRKLIVLLDIGKALHADDMILLRDQYNKAA